MPKYRNIVFGSHQASLHSLCRRQHHESEPLPDYVVTMGYIAPVAVWCLCFRRVVVCRGSCEIYKGGTVVYEYCMQVRV